MLHLQFHLRYFSSNILILLSFVNLIHCLSNVFNKDRIKKAPTSIDEVSVHYPYYLINHESNDGVSDLTACLSDFAD